MFNTLRVGRHVAPQQAAEDCRSQEFRLFNTLRVGRHVAPQQKGKNAFLIKKVTGITALINKDSLKPGTKLPGQLRSCKPAAWLTGVRSVYTLRVGRHAAPQQKGKNAFLIKKVTGSTARINKGSLLQAKKNLKYPSKVRYKIFGGYFNFKRTTQKNSKQHKNRAEEKKQKRTAVAYDVADIVLAKKIIIHMESAFLSQPVIPVPLSGDYASFKLVDNRITCALPEISTYQIAKFMYGTSP